MENEQEGSALSVFDQIGIGVAGFGKYGWWKCTCGGFAGFNSDPTASAVMPWCRNPNHDTDPKIAKAYVIRCDPETGKYSAEEDESGLGYSYTLTYEPLPPEIQAEMPAHD